MSETSSSSEAPTSSTASAPSASTARAPKNYTPAPARATFPPFNDHNGHLPPYAYTTHVTEKGPINTVYDVKFNPYITTADFFASATGTHLNFYEAKSNGELEMKNAFMDTNKDEEYYAIIWCLAKFSAGIAGLKEQPIVVFAGKTGNIRSINAFTKRKAKLYTGNGDAVNDLATDPTRPYLFASASKDMTVRLWHVKQAQAIVIFGGYRGSKDQVLSVDFHKSGGYLVSGCMDHTVRVWKFSDELDIQNAIAKAENAVENNNDEEATPPPPPVEGHFSTACTKDLHTNYVDCVKFMGNHIITKSCEPSMWLFKFGEFDDPSPCGRGIHKREETLAQPIAQLHVPHTDMWYIKFAMTNGPPGKAWVACGNQVGEVHLWDLHKIPITSDSNFVLKNAHLPKLIRVVDFNRAGDVMLAAGSDGRITRYDAWGKFQEKPQVKVANKLEAKRRGRAKK
uniref:WD_REPEATS_REGION domain-containing protein n=2 Tax=Panagrellus redivivus TaxID=6233 RepID=A0A7E4UY95_PANRE